MFLLLYYGFIIILALITWVLPFGGKIIAFAINFFIPEGLPFVDECIQIVGIVKHLSK